MNEKGATPKFCVAILKVPIVGAIGFTVRIAMVILLE